MTRAGCLVLITREFMGITISSPDDTSNYKPSHQSPSRFLKALMTLSASSIFGQHGDVSHLPSWTGLRLAVKMELCARFGKNQPPVRFAPLPQMTEQIPHHDRSKQGVRAQRKPADGPQLLLELARDARIEGVVARIVRTGRQLVDKQLAVPREEKFDSQQSNNIQRCRDVGRKPDSGFAHGGRKPRGHN